MYKLRILGGMRGAASPPASIRRWLWPLRRHPAAADIFLKRSMASAHHIIQNLNALPCRARQDRRSGRRTGLAAAEGEDGLGIQIETVRDLERGTALHDEVIRGTRHRPKPGRIRDEPSWVLLWSVLLCFLLCPASSSIVSSCSAE
jgi:hypothetical protein